MDSSLKPTFDRLQHTMIDLLEEIKDQPDSVLNTSPERGGWSVLQVIYHVVLVEEYALKYVKKKLSFGDDIPKAGFKGFLRGIYLKNVFRVPFKISAPDAVSEVSMPTDIRFWEILKKWKDNRAELEHFLNDLPDHLLKTALYKHPFVGKVTPKNMLAFFELHFKRHRRQLNKVMKEVKYVV